MEKVLIIFTLCLMVSFLMSEVFYRLRYPRVIGQILAGIVLGLPFFSSLFFLGENYFTALAKENPVAVMIDLLANLGVIFLLLVVGLELNYRRLRKVSRDAILIALFAAILPFTLGFLLMKVFGYPNLIALIVGVCLSVTAEGTKAMELMDLGKLNTRVGETMLEAGAMDDLLGAILLSGVLILALGVEELSPLGCLLTQDYTLLQKAGSLFHILLFPIELLLFVTLSYLMFKIFPKAIRYIRKERSETSELTAVMLMGLFIALLSGILGLGTILGALIAGLIIQLSIKNRREEKRMVDDLKIISFGLIVPFFFISIGLYFDIYSLLIHPLLLASIIGVAVLGKVVGSMMAEPFTDLTHRQLSLIGWGMNSRGVVELVIASIAYPLFMQENAMDVFSAIVAMAVITTLLFPLILRYEIKKYPGIMD